MVCAEHYGKLIQKKIWELEDFITYAYQEQCLTHQCYEWNMKTWEVGKVDTGGDQYQ